MITCGHPDGHTTSSRQGLGASARASLPDDVKVYGPRRPESATIVVTTLEVHRGSYTGSYSASSPDVNRHSNRGPSGEDVKSYSYESEVRTRRTPEATPPVAEGRPGRARADAGAHRVTTGLRMMWAHPILRG